MQFLLKYSIITSVVLAKTTRGTFESDAESCFNRIVMSCAIICFFMIWGAPIMAIQTWEKTLHNIKHHMKTGYGITKESYEYTDRSPIIGPGQGSKAGSPTCSTLMFLLLMAMDILAKGIYFISPNTSVEYTTKAILFADDNTNYNNNFKEWIRSPPTAQEVLKGIQDDSQTWERCLYTSGRRLKLHKCKYFLMMWEFDMKEKQD